MNITLAAKTHDAWGGDETSQNVPDDERGRCIYAKTIENENAHFDASSALKFPPAAPIYRYRPTDSCTVSSPDRGTTQGHPLDGTHINRGG